MNRQLLGPLTPEQLLLAYSKGLVDDASLVCGTEASLTERLQENAGQASGQAGLPPLSCFQPLQTLLNAVKNGAKYELVSWTPAPQ